MMAVNPITRVIAPRFLAGLIDMPLLAALFSAIGVLGGHLIGVGLVGVDAGAYWSQMQNGVDFYDDIVNGVVKSAVFGLVVAWIAVFEGYDAVPTSEGVASATNRTVVYSSLAVLALDFILTALMLRENCGSVCSWPPDCSRWPCWPSRSVISRARTCWMATSSRRASRISAASR
jgi:phospholipid/cholesterol/gamma-HCH transport system permease protein